MTLKEFCKAHDNEIEVWDRVVDIGCPYYNYGGDVSPYGDDEKDADLNLMEEWILSLPVDPISDSVCDVDVFSAVKDNWHDIVAGMTADGGYKHFLNGYEDIDDDDAIADYVEDVFTCLSQGYYGFAKDFCDFMKLRKDN